MDKTHRVEWSNPEGTFKGHGQPTARTLATVWADAMNRDHPELIHRVRPVEAAA